MPALPLGGKRVKFTQQVIENIKEFVAQGISRDEIANRLGVIILPNGSGAGGQSSRPVDGDLDATEDAFDCSSRTTVILVR
jgi:hypothetical protein